MDVPEQGLDNLLSQLPKQREVRIFSGGSQFIEQATLSPGCIAYQSSAERMDDLYRKVQDEHEGWEFVEIVSDGRGNVRYALAYDPTVEGNAGDVSQALGDAKLICKVDDQENTSLVFIRAYHEDRSPITDTEIVQRLAFVSGKLHKAGYFKGLGSDNETTPVLTRDGTFLFSLPKQQGVRRSEREVDIVDHQENHVSITVHEMSGPSGSVFALEIPEDYAKGNNIDLHQARVVLNRAIEKLEGQLPEDSPFPDLIPLPTLWKEGATSEPHRLFVVATRAHEGHGGHRDDLSKLARKAKVLGMRVKLSADQVDLTINAPVDTILFISELNLNGALGTLYSALESIHGDPDDPTHLRIITTNSKTNRNAYRMKGDKRCFAFSVASI